MRHNVSTPGGFFVGLGGIIAFCVVSSLVYLWVKNPAPSEELRQQQAALGLAAAPDAPRDEVKRKREETDLLLEAAATKYNGGKKPNIDRLAELRGVVRFREAQKVAETSEMALAAPSSAPGKTVLAAAIDEVAKEIVAKKPAPSKVALAEAGPVDPKAAPALPNASGGGVRTVQFSKPLQPAPPAPEAAPVPAAAPAAAPAAPGDAPAPAPGAAPSTTPPPPPAAPAPPAPPTPAPAPPTPPINAPPAAPAPAPAAPAAPNAPNAPNAPAAAPVPPQANVSLEPAAPIAATAPSRPPLLNWSATK